MNPVIIVLLVAVVWFVTNVFRVLKEYERGVVFFLGKYRATRGPGLIILIPFLEKIVKVDQRVVTMDVPTQDVITKDNVTIKVNAVLYFRVMEPAKAIIRVENFLYATSQLAQTTLRSVCGEAELDDLLVSREEINVRIQEIIDKQTDPWGIKVTTVELKDIDLPQEMKRAMAQQAEAERERRAKIIKAQGEYEASEKLTEAANVMASQSLTIQLRFLETLRDIATEHNSTIVFPIPIELLEVAKGLSKKS
ncbi:MAG: slipin family protein [Bdellovibrionales bacterium]|nr:slipin family protein [Bdellovibrionales bacterium]